MIWFLSKPGNGISIKIAKLGMGKKYFRDGMVNNAQCMDDLFDTNSDPSINMYIIRECVSLLFCRRLRFK